MFWFPVKCTVFQNVLPYNTKCRLYLTKYSDYNTQFTYGTSVTPAASLLTCSCHSAGPPQLLGRHSRVEARSSPLLSEMFLVVVWLFILCVGMSPSLPALHPHVHAGLADLGKYFHSLNKLREKHFHHC